MRYHLPRTLAEAVLLVASLVLLLGLSIAPLNASRARAAGDVRPLAATLTLSGPTSITANGNYTYGASFYVPYARFVWYSRTCSTATVASCTATWNLTSGTMTSDYTSQYTRYLTRDCSGNGTRSFQVRVDASGFGQPTQTKAIATKLCGDVLP
ncbi:MAG TPA: hypothetical protein VGD69_29085 [Herpetosiphonaceae bacterium]